MSDTPEPFDQVFGYFLKPRPTTDFFIGLVKEMQKSLKTLIAETGYELPKEAKRVFAFEPCRVSDDEMLIGYSLGTGPQQHIVRLISKQDEHPPGYDGDHSKTIIHKESDAAVFADYRRITKVIAHRMIETYQLTMAKTTKTPRTPRSTGKGAATALISAIDIAHWTAIIHQVFIDYMGIVYQNKMASNPKYTPIIPGVNIGPIRPMKNNIHQFTIDAGGSLDGYMFSTKLTVNVGEMVYLFDSGPEVFNTPLHSSAKLPNDKIRAVFILHEVIDRLKLLANMAIEERTAKPDTPKEEATPQPTIRLKTPEEIRGEAMDELIGAAKLGNVPGEDVALQVTKFIESLKTNLQTTVNEKFAFPVPVRVLFGSYTADLSMFNMDIYVEVPGIYVRKYGSLFAESTATLRVTYVPLTILLNDKPQSVVIENHDPLLKVGVQSTPAQGLTPAPNRRITIHHSQLSTIDFTKAADVVLSHLASIFRDHGLSISNLRTWEEISDVNVRVTNSVRGSESVQTLVTEPDVPTKGLTAGGRMALVGCSALLNEIVDKMNDLTWGANPQNVVTYGQDIADYRKAAIERVAEMNDGSVYKIGEALENLRDIIKG